VRYTAKNVQFTALWCLTAGVVGLLATVVGEVRTKRACAGSVALGSACCFFAVIEGNSHWETLQLPLVRGVLLAFHGAVAVLGLCSVPGIKCCGRASDSASGGTALGRPTCAYYVGWGMAVIWLVVVSAVSVADPAGLAEHFGVGTPGEGDGDKVAALNLVLNTQVVPGLAISTALAMVGILLSGDIRTLRSVNTFLCVAVFARGVDLAASLPALASLGASDVAMQGLTLATAVFMVLFVLFLAAVISDAGGGRRGLHPLLSLGLFLVYWLPVAWQQLTSPAEWADHVVHVNLSEAGQAAQLFTTQAIQCSGLWGLTCGGVGLLVLLVGQEHTKSNVAVGIALGMVAWGALQWHNRQIYTDLLQQSEQSVVQKAGATAVIAVLALGAAPGGGRRKYEGGTPWVHCLVWIAVFGLLMAAGTVCLKSQGWSSGQGTQQVQGIQKIVIDQNPPMMIAVAAAVLGVFVSGDLPALRVMNTFLAVSAGAFGAFFTDAQPALTQVGAPDAMVHAAYLASSAAFLAVVGFVLCSLSDAGTSTKGLHPVISIGFFLLCWLAAAPRMVMEPGSWAEQYAVVKHLELSAQTTQAVQFGGLWAMTAGGIGLLALLVGRDSTKSNVALGLGLGMVLSAWRQWTHKHDWTDVLGATEKSFYRQFISTCVMMFFGFAAAPGAKCRRCESGCYFCLYLIAWGIVIGMLVTGVMISEASPVFVEQQVQTASLSTEQKAFDAFLFDSTTAGLVLSCIGAMAGILLSGDIANLRTTNTFLCVGAFAQASFFAGSTPAEGLTGGFKPLGAAGFCILVFLVLLLPVIGEGRRPPAPDGYQELPAGKPPVVGTSSGAAEPPKEKPRGSQTVADPRQSWNWQQIEAHKSQQRR